MLCWTQKGKKGTQHFSSIPFPLGQRSTSCSAFILISGCNEEKCENFLHKEILYEDSLDLRALSENLQETFPQPLWSFGDHLVNLWWTFNETTMNLQWTFNEPLMNLQWIFNEPSMNLQWTFDESSMNLWQTFKHLKRNEFERTPSIPFLCGKVSLRSSTKFLLPSFQ